MKKSCNRVIAVIHFNRGKLYIRHVFTHAELREELGGQPVVSAILNGKRDINARQAKTLASRFKVPAGTFIR